MIRIQDIAPPVEAASLEAKERGLIERLKRLQRVAVAYSGGVDSGLLLAVAVETLGADATALTAVSASFAERERQAAGELASRIGARQIEIPTSEVADPRYAENTAARCYFCKDVVYRALADYAAGHDLGPVVDGMNRDDTVQHRPGRRAAEEMGIASPLFEAGLSKADVRELARRRELPVWDKPAMACLSSRIPYGQSVTPEKLSRIEAAEAIVSDAGCRVVRVRDHGDVARIEVAPDEIAFVLAERDRIAAELRRLGYRHVALDLEGYRSGSLNSVLEP